jgi:hypothetical protein
MSLKMASFIFTLFFAASSWARVFNFGQENFAGYIRGTYGGSGKSNTMLSESSGNDLTLDSSYANVSGGEFGFVYASQVVNTRIGFELIRPPDLKDRSATNAAEAQLYTVTSETTIFIPKIVFEVEMKRWSKYRMMLNLGAGTASLTGRNSYVLTDAGGTELAPIVEHYEDLRGNALMYEGSVVFEGLLSDTTTYMLEAGYRSLNFTTITHNRDVATFSGTVVKGDSAVNMDGSKRTLNLTQIYYALGFRFWVF